jgi:hypothetical protein
VVCDGVLDDTEQFFRSIDGANRQLVKQLDYFVDKNNKRVKK